MSILVVDESRGIRMIVMCTMAVLGLHDLVIGVPRAVTADSETAELGIRR